MNRLIPGAFSKEEGSGHRPAPEFVPVQDRPPNPMSEPHFDLDIEYTRPWEHETSFNDVLAETLHKFPYLLISLALHALVAAALAGFAFLRGGDQEAPLIEMAAQPPPPEVEEIEEPPEEIVEEIVEEPVLQESELEEVVEQETLEETGDPDFNSDSPFDNESWNNDVGLGGGAGGKYGGRGGRGGRRGKGSATEKAVSAALKWLYDHQSADGYWDCDEFMYEDKYPDKPPSDGPGNPVNDVGVSGLGLLAFLGANHTMSQGTYKDTVSKGINWLKSVQLENGLFGDEVGNPTLYNHSIATMAMGEAYYFSNRSPILRKPMKNAVKLIVNAQNPYGAWRYTLEPNGSSDSSVTGWMIFALKTAEDGKVAVNDDAYEWAETWFETMTDPQTGRTGYTWGEGGGPGSLPSRPAHYVDRFPAEKSEALTAVALLCRIFMTDTDKVKRWRDHPQYEMLKKQADLILRKLPEWDEAGGSCDFYYWYYATFAMNQWGGEHWKTWQKEIEKTMVKNQRMENPEDNFYGSWDPVGPWGEEGGRVYTTATGALILEVYYRYANVLGAR